ncbi:phenylalanine--tRNA ligase subunit alpha [Candidatus Bathyarchaeota archaeon]|nr:phenylalanine--tRNA ligase subunit alpha [Candidatus Bathyarchaeota archaeon]
MVDSELIEQLSLSEKKVLKALGRLRKAAPEAVQEECGFSRLVEVMNAASWLQAKGLVSIEEEITKTYSLRRGEAALKPLPERTMVSMLVDNFGGKGSLAELKRDGRLKNEEIQIALGWLRRKGWGDISKEGDETFVTVTDEGRQALSMKGDDELIIERLKKGEVTEKDASAQVLEMLKQRKDFLNERHAVSRKIELTPKGAEIASADLEIQEEVAQLTPELIQSGKWREIGVRKYDVKAFAPAAVGGRRHPMTLLINKIRNVFLTMGFTEIKGHYVESAFWNMDVLFTAQDHPARDTQDTFYLDRPERIDLSGDKDLVDIVKQVHENGWSTGSQGWRYDWRIDEAERALLRTHTTVNTARYIAQNPQLPFKVFTIGRIFRSEAMDSTHLPEFMQIEGIVCEEGANFDMLCALLKEFYKRMGIPKIRIRPGYFPYTEPSLELEIFWNGQWMELGGAGVFRPEVTKPLGVEEPVLAWGLGLERLGMLMWDLDDIREIYVSDIDWLKKAPQI